MYLQSSRNVYNPNETNSFTVISFNFFPSSPIFHRSRFFSSLLWMILQKKQNSLNLFLLIFFFFFFCCVDKFQNIKNITTNLTTVWVCVCVYNMRCLFVMSKLRLFSLVARSKMCHYFVLMFSFVGLLL